MSVKISEIMGYMEEIAPEGLKESWDNPGLLVGQASAYVDRILVALDAVDDVINEAVEKKCGLIITHHPIIFNAVKSVSDSTPLGRRIIKLIKNDIAVFSAHTNFDICSKGTNVFLAKLIGLENIENLCPPVLGNDGLGKVGALKKEMTFIEFAETIKKLLNLKNLTITGDKNKIIKKVGICTGSGADRELIGLAKNSGCDVYLTGDVKFHDAQFANDLDICLIDATHYGTEAIAMKTICDYLENIKKDNSLEFQCMLSEVNGQTLNII